MELIESSVLKLNKTHSVDNVFSNKTHLSSGWWGARVFMRNVLAAVWVDSFWGPKV